MPIEKHNVLIPNMKYNGLNPIHFGYGSCFRNHCFGPATRTNWVIHFVVSGFGNFFIDNKNYRLGPGEMFVIPPGKVTFYQADSENPWSYIWIGFSCDFNIGEILSDTMHLPDALVIFNAMKKCKDAGNGKSAFLAARLWDLYALILGKSSEDSDYVQRAIDYIHSEYMNKLTIQSIANKLNLDRSYFSTLFKSKIGVSPMQYLMNYRMSVAASLMLNEKKSVSVAAFSVGYSDVFNFSKMFKVHYGVSPTKYVRNKTHT